jgi:hypothetical protein
MSTAFAEAAKAMTDNPELASSVMAAGTPAERAEILKAAGVAVPTHADVSAAHASLGDVSGAGGNTTAQISAAVPAAVPAAASAVAAS